MFNDYLSHLVQEEAQSTINKSDWSYVNEYIRWFFKVSHPYMVQTSPEDPPRPSHQEKLEEEQTQLDNAHDVLLRCRRIMEIVQEDIDICIFPDGSDVRQVLYTIMTEARETLMYQRQHR